jgi:hypothetical protein
VGHFQAQLLEVGTLWHRRATFSVNRGRKLVYH